MSPAVAGIVGFGLLFVLLFLGMPVGFAMGLMGFLGFAYIASVEGAFGVVAAVPYETMSHYTMTTLPMFLVMGNLAYESGFANRLYSSAYAWFGQQRGGLAMSTVVGCAAFAGICGSSLATAATFGAVAEPEMRRHNYDPRLSTGCIAAGGTLGILIPPSVAFIIYGMLTEVSIGKLFIAGILPGVLLAALFIAAIYLWVLASPNLGPSAAKTSMRQKLSSLGGVSETLLIFLLIMGGLFLGWFTPTEAGAAGAFAVLLTAFARGQLNSRGLVKALWTSGLTAGMTYTILIGATIFNRFLAVSMLPAMLAEWVSGLNLTPLGIIVAILAVYIVLGCVMDTLAMILLTVPLFFPVVVSLGFDPIWFGVLIVLMMELGMITPPVGVNVFVLGGVVRDVPLETIFRGIFPFIPAMLACIALLVAFPQIALFLVRVMG